MRSQSILIEHFYNGGSEYNGERVNPLINSNLSLAFQYNQF